MTIVWGLTGGIACGKSTVAALLRHHGAIVIDADDIARDVVTPGSDGLREVIERFGTHLLRPDGTLDRATLGDLVFRDPTARDDLNRILHPRIAAASLARIAEAAASHPPAVFYDAALLVENGTWRMFQGLLVVACEPDTQRARLQARDGLDADAAQARIDAQLPLADKIRVATHVIRNDGDLDDLNHQVARFASTWKGP